MTKPDSTKRPTGQDKNKYTKSIIQLLFILFGLFGFFFSPSSLNCQIKQKLQELPVNHYLQFLITAVHRDRNMGRILTAKRAKESDL